MDDRDEWRERERERKKEKQRVRGKFVLAGEYDDERIINYSSIVLETQQKRVRSQLNFLKQ